MDDGRKRIVIEGVSPEIDGGRFPAKRILHDRVLVEADIFADGHDVLSARIKYRHVSDPDWSLATMSPGPNDRWSGTFPVEKLGRYRFAIEGWVNRYLTWRRSLEKKAAAGVDVAVELLGAGEHLQTAARHARSAEEQRILKEALSALAPGSDVPYPERLRIALDPRLGETINSHLPPEHAASYDRELEVEVDAPLARFSAWYELFPRSCAAEPGRHGTFQDCERWLARIARMGFDVVYLPPIHPIGRSFRKGKNNRLTANPDEPGSPWAIGSEAGGHKSVHPELGTLEDFRHLVAAARELDLEIALDIAFQCSPDHPYVREHPEWFRHRPDGSIQYAENPPKKYQDIFPLDFETADWQALWTELKSIFEFWIDQGVRVFRVDNPHTKSVRFWEWCLGELKRERPHLVFLSEAFTRPKVMNYLAKLGFTQSYNYFPWRNTRHEIEEYLTQLTRGPEKEYLRPNLWPNTPDILTEYLQFGGRPAFMSRLVLAATLGASYGVYGPPFETVETEPREPGSEEYLNSEKYEIRFWTLDQPGHLGGLMERVNRIRRENPALHTNETLRFHDVDNDQLIAYSKHAENGENLVLTVVNLDPYHAQSGWVHFDLGQWSRKPPDSYQMHELLTGERHLWSGTHNYVELNPAFAPAHVFRVRHLIRTERDFDYFF